MRSCYLCDYTYKKKKPGIALHRFPPNAKIRKEWFRICQLSEEIDEVKNVRICTSHFAFNDVRPPPFGSTKKYPTLRFDAVPSVSVPRPIDTETDISYRKNFVKTSQSDKIPSDDFLKNNAIKLVMPIMSTIQSNQIQTQLPVNFQMTPGSNTAPILVGSSRNYRPLKIRGSSETPILGGSSTNYRSLQIKASNEAPILVASSINYQPLEIKCLPSVSLVHPVQIQTQLPFLKNFEDRAGANGVSSLVNFKSEAQTPVVMGQTILPVLPQSTKTDGTINTLQTPADMGETILPVLPQSIKTEDEIATCTCEAQTAADMGEAVLPELSYVAETVDVTTSAESINSDTKYRRFEMPRYIPEIRASDFSSPERINVILNLVKRIDSKKSQKIRDLQNQKRYLTNRVTALKNFVKHLKADVKEAIKISSNKNIKTKLAVTKDRIKCKNVKKL